MLTTGHGWLIGTAGGMILNRGEEMEIVDEEVSIS